MTGDSQVKLTLAQLLASYEETLGVEGARKLISNTLATAGFPKKTEFTLDEMVVICKVLSGHHGFIATAAGILLARLKLRDWKTQANKIASTTKF